MRRQKIKFLSLFLSILIVISVVPVQAFGASDDACHLLTSYCDYDYLDLTISGSTLHVSGIITFEHLGLIRAYVSGHPTQNTLTEGSWININASSGEPFSFDLALSGSVEQLFHMSISGPNYTYNAGYTGKAIFIEKTDNGYQFAKSSALDNNLLLSTGWVNPADCKGQGVSQEVQTLSDSIVVDVADDYTKCFLLYKWVTENIYYDEDYISDRSLGVTYKPDDVIKSKRTVCEGYAELLVELLHAQGIPAFVSGVYCLGAGTTYWSFSEEKFRTGEVSLPSSANHACVEAFVNGRWVLMEPTWDSSLIYRNGRYVNVCSAFFYFDATPEMFALDHMIFQRDTVCLRDGNLMNNADAACIPSTWAQALVLNAIGEGLVPDEYQRNYTSGISRAAMCRLAVELIEAKTGSTIDEYLTAYGKSADSVFFADTADSYVLACKALGIVDGTGKDSAGNALFRPDNTLTRAQAAVYAVKLAKLFGMQTDGFPNTFSDTEGHWSAPFVGWASSTGIVSGTSSSTYDPDGILTMEQAIIIISKTLDAIHD